MIKRLILIFPLLFVTSHLFSTEYYNYNEDGYLLEYKSIGDDFKHIETFSYDDEGKLIETVCVETLSTNEYSYELSACYLMNELGYLIENTISEYEDSTVRTSIYEETSLYYPNGLASETTVYRYEYNYITGDYSESEFTCYYEIDGSIKDVDGKSVSY